MPAGRIQGRDGGFKIRKRPVQFSGLPAQFSHAVTVNMLRALLKEISFNCFIGGLLAKETACIIPAAFIQVSGIVKVRLGLG
jgi:hypothetical protein